MCNICPEICGIKTERAVLHFFHFNFKLRRQTKFFRPKNSHQWSETKMHTYLMEKQILSTLTLMYHLQGCGSTQHNDIQHNDTQHNVLVCDTQHK